MKDAMNINNKYHSEHYNAFQENLSSNEDWPGNNIKAWWNYVTNNAPSNLPEKRLSRYELKKLCQNNKYSAEECMGSVMAWGGQNRKHGQTLFSRKDEIIPIVQNMRNGHLDHISAYKNFYEIWKQNKPLGMGAAYFTKLIFFCEPSHEGFIMDQWTSKSTNLILGRNVIQLTNNIVNKKNDHITYDTYCKFVQEIAKDLKESAEYIEIGMFSKGGRTKSAWRQYVVDNWE